MDISHDSSARFTHIRLAGADLDFVVSVCVIRLRKLYHSQSTFIHGPFRSKSLENLIDLRSGSASFIQHKVLFLLYLLSCFLTPSLARFAYLNTASYRTGRFDGVVRSSPVCSDSGEERHSPREQQHFWHRCTLQTTTWVAS